jgi:hypothetical protein
MMFDTLLINGNILSMDHARNTYGWMAISDGKIAALGKHNDYPKDAQRVIDLKNHTVLPGFIDSHTHGSLTGLSLASADLREAASIDELLAVLKEKADHTDEGVVVIGTNMSAEKLRENRLPERRELDEVSSRHPILVHHVTMHGCVMNSSAFEISQLHTEMDGVDTYEDGSPNGIISDDSAYYMGVGNIMKSLSEDTIESYIKMFTDSLPSAGVTTVHTLDGQDLPMDAPVWHRMQRKHPVHVINYLETLDVEKAKSMGYPRVGGCIALDGSRVMKTMALNEPYAHSPGRGTLYFTDDTIYKFMTQAHANDMQLSLHVGGERAIDQFLFNLYRVEKEQGFKDLRHRPEHFSMPSDRAIELAVEMKLALPMQPRFTELWDDPKDSLYVKNLGPDRARRMEPFAEIIKRGGIICGGSDSPITPVNPLKGIHQAVNDPNSFRTVGLMDAVKMFTVNGAWAAHEENRKGTLEAGKLADLVALDRDPFTCPNQICDIQIEMTMVKGEIVYGK